MTILRALSLLVDKTEEEFISNEEPIDMSDLDSRIEIRDSFHLHQRKATIRRIQTGQGICLRGSTHRSSFESNPPASNRRAGERLFNQEAVAIKNVRNDEGADSDQQYSAATLLVNLFSEFTEYEPNSEELDVTCGTRDSFNLKLEKDKRSKDQSDHRTPRCQADKSLVYTARQA